MQQRFFVKKEINEASSKKLWSREEDEVLLEKVTPLVENKSRLSWKKIFDEIKNELPGRSRIAMETRWDNWLNPQWAKVEVDDVERSKIFYNFEKYGFTFSLYENRKRSVPFYRVFISHHVKDVHESQSTKPICEHFYEHLEELLKRRGTENISVDEWMDACSGGERRIKMAYKLLLYKRMHHLGPKYGICVKEGRAHIDMRCFQEFLPKFNDFQCMLLRFCTIFDYKFLDV